MRSISWIAISLLLTGCRQPEPAPKVMPKASTEASPQLSEAAPKPSPAADARPVIACFGDSITAGFGLEPFQSFPALLQQDLDQHRYGYRVASLGVSGDTTQDGVARLPLLLAEKPVIVVLELGGNDGLRGLPVSVTESNLAEIIEGVQKTGARILLAGMTLPPNYGPAYIRKFEAIYRDLAARYQLALIPFLMAGVGGNADLMQRDGLHPNARGAGRIEVTVMKALAPLLK
jgi:acyl-CoA thioesterase-1